MTCFSSAGTGDPVRIEGKMDGAKNTDRFSRNTCYLQLGNWRWEYGSPFNVTITWSTPLKQLWSGWRTWGGLVSALTSVPLTWRGQSIYCSQAVWLSGNNSVKMNGKICLPLDVQCWCRCSQSGARLQFKQKLLPQSTESVGMLLIQNIYFIFYFSCRNVMSLYSLKHREM